MNNKKIVVIGGCNIDIIAHPVNCLIPEDSAPGKVKMQPGGVGRNIANFLSLFSSNVTLLTILGSDPAANMVRAVSKEYGFTITSARQAADTSSYLAVTDQDHKLIYAINDMAAIEQLALADILVYQNLLQQAEAIVIEANLSQQLLFDLTSHFSEKRIFFDAVSSYKASRIMPCLDKIDTAKLNKLEAEKISGITISDEQAVVKAGKKLNESGINNIFISLGAEGLFYCNKNEAGLVPAPKLAIKTSNQLGDCTMAVITDSLLSGFSAELCAQRAVTAASLLAQSGSIAALKKQKCSF